MKWFVMAACVLACTCREDVSDPYRVSPGLEVHLTRTDCFGTCPAYDLVIRGDGHVTFDGKRFVTAVGRHEKQIAVESAQRLAGEFEKARFFDIPRNPPCPAPPPDSPSATVTLVVPGRRHSVEHYYGCRESAVFDKLRSLEAAIDDAAAIEAWRHYDPAIEARRRILAQFDACSDAAGCEAVSHELSRRALAIYEETEQDTFTTRRAIVCSDGTFWLRDTSFRFVRAMTGRLTIAERDTLRDFVKAPAEPLVAVPERDTDPLLVSMLARPRNDTLEVIAYDALTAPASVHRIDALLHEIIISRRFIGRSLHVSVETIDASANKPETTAPWPADARPLLEMEQPVAGYEILKMLSALHVDRTAFGEPTALAGDHPSWLILRTDDAAYHPDCQ